MDRRRKSAAAVLVLALALMLGGCGGSGAQGNGDLDTAQTDDFTNIVEIKKDGTLSNTTEAALLPEDADEELVKDFVLRAASACNASLGGEQIAVKKLTVKKDRVTLTMDYQSAEAFGAFHNYPFFCGTVSEAYEQGYNLDITLTEAGYDPDKASGEPASVGKEDLLAMGSRNILIVQLPPSETLTVRTGGKILYLCGEGIDLQKNSTAYLQGKETDGVRETVYLVYK